MASAVRSWMPTSPALTFHQSRRAWFGSFRGSRNPCSRIHFARRFETPFCRMLLGRIAGAMAIEQRPRAAARHKLEEAGLDDCSMNRDSPLTPLVLERAAIFSRGKVHDVDALLRS